MNPIRRVASGVKAFAIRFASASRPWWTWSLGRTRFDYRREVGDGRGNSIVQSCILWFCRTFPEAPLRLWTVNAEGEEDEQVNHPLKLLLDTPNPYYSGELLWWGTLADWMLGNAYWLKVRSGSGRPVELWWVPSTLIEPKWPADGSQFISHYEYRPGVGEPTRLDPADVVHFRYGMDPVNIRKGLSPLGSLLREVFTDDEAANYTASMLRNVGVPPVVISPGPDAKPSQEDLDEVKTGYMERTTGDHRGEPMVMRGPTDIKVLGFRPDQMDTKMSRRVPEERVSAIFGIPAVVVGLGAGLDRSTFANFAEAREAAYESNVIPSQRLLAAELRTQLLPDFGDVTKLKLGFDLTKVRVLQADENDLHTRAREDLKAGGIKLNEFRKMIALPPLDGDVGDAVYVPIGLTPTHVDEVLTRPTQADIGTIGQPDTRTDGQPAKVLRLPARQAKAANDVGDATQRLRERLQQAAEAVLADYLLRQQKRVVVRWSGMPDADPEALVTDTDLEQLRALLAPVYGRVLSGVHGLIEDGLRITFELDAIGTRNYLATAGTNIVGINETTLRAVRQALLEAQHAGESVAQTAQRLSELPEFGQARAMTIARTEIAQASNRAAVHVYRSSGVVLGIQIVDGEEFDEPCKARNGKILTFEAAETEPPLLHPNCTARFLPVTQPSQMEVAA
jgi:HK97 family phage portal protein